jgi:hypothetical protein
MARRQLYDRRGAVLVLENGVATFICAWCDRTFAVLDADGMRTIAANHSSKKHRNFVSFTAMRRAMNYVARYAKRKR